MIDTVIAHKRCSYDEDIRNLLDKYALTKAPIEVSFRKLVPQFQKAERATHLIHTYPAKLLMHIPHFFLNNNVFSKEGDIVLDPFSGSGTVLLESMLAGRNAIGADSNPLARLISRVKTTNYDIELLQLYSNLLFKSIPEDSQFAAPRVGNINYWFLPHIQNQLIRIIEGIKNIPDPVYQDFFWVCFSNCVKKVSLADPRVSVPVRLRSTQYDKEHFLYKGTVRKLESFETLDVYAKLKECIDSNITRFNNLYKIKSSNSTVNIVSDDARKLEVESVDGKEYNGQASDQSVSLIISSPPYAGAQKYIRASSLSLGWLDYIKNEHSLKQLEDLNIGREHYKKELYKVFTSSGVAEADELLYEIFNVNPLRAYIAGNYLNEMRDAFKESIRVLKPGGYFVLIAANNQVCGREFKTQEYLLKIIEELGLRVVLRLIDDIKSYGLMTKRNKTANIITREWVLVFQK